LGHRQAVDRWLAKNREEFAALAEQRRIAGQKMLEQAIRLNMQELIDLLVSDADMLPCEAAERIAVDRIASSESDRTVADVMVSIATILESQTVREAAELLIADKGDMLGVVSRTGELVGVVTDWDITEASATGCGDDIPVSQIMSREVVAACPTESILDVVRKLEYHEISAMPVVTEDGCIGAINSDILAQRTLYRLLQAQGSY
jgi:CBS domain-containing protein